MPFPVSSSTPAVGYFNDDDVPDVMVQFAIGPGYPLYDYGYVSLRELVLIDFSCPRSDVLDANLITDDSPRRPHGETIARATHHLRWRRDVFSALPIPGDYICSQTVFGLLLHVHLHDSQVVVPLLDSRMLRTRAASRAAREHQFGGPVAAALRVRRRFLAELAEQRRQLCAPLQRYVRRPRAHSRQRAEFAWIQALRLGYMNLK